jgi:hypothetical protein
VLIGDKMYKEKINIMNFPLKKNWKNLNEEILELDERFISIAKEIFAGLSPTDRQIKSVARCVSKYFEKSEAEGITMGLKKVALYTVSEDEIVRTANIMCSKRIFDSTEGLGQNVISSLTWIAHNIKDQKVLWKIVSCISKYGSSAEPITSLFEKLVNRGYCNEEIIKIARWLSSNKVVSCVSKYKDAATVEEIIKSLEQIVIYIKSENAVLDLISNISKYDEEVARKIARAIAQVTKNTEDGNLLWDSVKKISEAKTPEEAAEIAEEIYLSNISIDELENC